MTVVEPGQLWGPLREALAGRGCVAPAGVSTSSTPKCGPRIAVSDSAGRA